MWARWNGWDRWDGWDEQDGWDGMDGMDGGDEQEGWVGFVGLRLAHTKGAARQHLSKSQGFGTSAKLRRRELNPGLPNGRKY